MMRYVLTIKQFKELLDEDLITAQQYNHKVFETIQNDTDKHISTSDAKYLLKAFKQLEADGLIDPDVYDGLADIILVKIKHTTKKKITMEESKEDINIQLSGRVTVQEPELNISAQGPLTRQIESNKFLNMVQVDEEKSQAGNYKQSLTLNQGKIWGKRIILIRWVILTVAFIFSAAIYGISKEFIPPSGLAGLIRGAVIFGFLYEIWNMTKKIGE